MKFARRFVIPFLTLLLLGSREGMAEAQSGELETQDKGGTVYMSDSYYWQTHTPLGPALLT